MIIFSDNAPPETHSFFMLNLITNKHSIRHDSSTLHHIFPAPPNQVTQMNNIMNLKFSGDQRGNREVGEPSMSKSQICVGIGEIFLQTP
jgi:hypothetical protein